MFKYADDTTLLVPEHTDINIDIEFSRVKAWTPIKRTLSLGKTKKLFSSDLHSFHLPPAIDYIQQACNCFKLKKINGHAC